MPDDRIARYQKLPAHQRTAVQFLAVAMEPLNVSDIGASLTRLKIKEENGGSIPPESWPPILDSLCKGNLLHRPTKTKLTCSEVLGSIAVTDALASGFFAAFNEELHRLQPLAKGGRGFGTLQRFYRHLRDHLFVGAEWREITELAHTAAYEFPRKTNLRQALVTLFGSPFDGRQLSFFPQDSQLFVIIELLHVATHDLTPAEPLFDFLRSARWPGHAVAYRHGLLAYYLTHWGYWQEGEKHYALLADKDKLFHPGLAAWHQTLAGHDREAVAQYTVKLKELLKFIGKRKYFFDDLAGVFFILSLVRSGLPENFVQARRHMETLASLNSHPLQHFCETLREIVALAEGGGIDREEDRPAKSGTARGLPQSILKAIAARKRAASPGLTPVATLLKALVDFWKDKNTCRAEWQDTLIGLRDKAHNAGHVWLTMETAELLARLGVDSKANQALAASLRDRYGFVSIADVIPRTDPWERCLRALINLSATAGTTTAGRGKSGSDAPQRLIWLLDYREEYGFRELLPRLQVRRKNGTWSAGRAVALKNLGEGAATMEGLSDQDRAVCATIRMTYYGYSSREFYFETENALAALAGHPLLFLADSENRIDLVAGEPELLVTRGKENIEIRIEPPPGADGRFWRLLRETPTRFKLVRFTDRHMSIASVLAQRIEAPPEAQALAEQAITALSSLITVHSDLDGAATGSREVEADPCPHIHLQPRQDGLKAEILVKPLPGAEAWYPPGTGGLKVFAEVEREKLHAVRDLEIERQRATDLVAACPTLAANEAIDGEFLVPGPEASLDLLLELREFGDRAVVEWPRGESLKVRGRASVSSLSLRIQGERDWFKASGSLTLDDGDVISLQKLLALLALSGGNFVRLDDGSFLALTREFRNRLEALRDIGEPQGDGVRFSPLAALAMEDLDQDLGKFEADRRWKNNLARFDKTVDPAVPSTLQAELRDYQITGFAWMAQLAHWGVGACLADDMGLGKTIQALAVLLRLAPEGPALVVAPLSVLMNWQDEARRFAPTLNVIVFGGGDRQQTLDRLGPFDLMVCSYGLLQSEAERLTGVEWRAIVLDEAQAIKNMNTKRSKAAKGLSGQFRLITTGTPVENHLGELWNLFDFVNPGLLGSFRHFNQAFMAPSDPEQEKQARRRLRKLIRPFILRRLKSQVLQELPSRTEVTLRVEMSAEEAALYEAQRRLSLEKIAAGNESGHRQPLRILAEIMRLRRLCCNPGLVLPDSRIASSKLKVFGDLLDDIRDNNHKALVFSQFVDHLAILSAFLDQRGIPYQYLDGSTPAAARTKRINAFQAGNGDIFLISLKAGGSGLNLTAADYVIHMDPWWNPAVEDQASDRAHRIGQQRPVTIYRLVMAGSIEEQIIKLHREKRDLADSLLAGGDAAGALNADELLALLKGA